MSKKLAKSWICSQCDHQFESGVVFPDCPKCGEIGNPPMKTPKRKDGWISVKKRLPENSRTVIVHVPQSRGQYSVGAAYRSATDWRWIEGIPIVTKPVTHWREMPPPPKGKS